MCIPLADPLACQSAPSHLEILYMAHKNIRWVPLEQKMHLKYMHNIWYSSIIWTPLLTTHITKVVQIVPGMTRERLKRKQASKYSQNFLGFKSIDDLEIPTNTSFSVSSFFNDNSFSSSFPRIVIYRIKIKIYKFHCQVYYYYKYAWLFSVVGLLNSNLLCFSIQNNKSSAPWSDITCNHIVHAAYNYV